MCYWINIWLLILCLISYNVLYDMVQVWQVSFKSERNVLCQRHFLSHNRLPQNKSFCFKGANVSLYAWSYCLCIGLEKYTLLFYLGLGKSYCILFGKGDLVHLILTGTAKKPQLLSSSLSFSGHRGYKVCSLDDRSKTRMLLWSMVPIDLGTRLPNTGLILSP